MRFWAILVCVLIWADGFSQSFDLVDRQESYQTGVSQTLRIPIRIRNNSDKPQTYIIRKIQDDLNDTQKGYFCLDKNCLEPGSVEISRKLEPGEVLSGLFFTIETGLLTGQHNLRFEIFPLGTTYPTLEHPVTIVIDDKSSRAMFYHSRDITIHDVYPNPATDVASIDYSIRNDLVKARVVINNILGKVLADYELPVGDSKIKIQTDELPAGVYFYTLYVNNEGVSTRKLIVRK